MATNGRSGVIAVPRVVALLVLALANVIQTPLRALPATDQPQPRLLAQSPGPLTLSETPAWAPLIDADTQQPLSATVLRQQLVGGRLFLVLKDITAQAQPGTAFTVYLGVPASFRGSRDDTHYVGRLAFFDEISHGSLTATP